MALPGQGSCINGGSLLVSQVEFTTFSSGVVNLRGVLPSDAGQTGIRNTAAAVSQCRLERFLFPHQGACRVEGTARSASLATALPGGAAACEAPLIEGRGHMMCRRPCR